MWEQQSHSHGSVSGTAKVRRTAGNPFSLQRTPDVHISSALSLPLFFFSVSLPLSPVKGWKKRTGKVAFQLWNWLFLLPTAFSRFPTLCPRCGQSGVETTKLCGNNLDELLELKMEILVFLGCFSSINRYRNSIWHLNRLSFETTQHPWTNELMLFHWVVLFLWWIWCGEAGTNQASTRRKKTDWYKE